MENAVHCLVSKQNSIHVTSSIIDDAKQIQIECNSHKVLLYFSNIKTEPGYQNIQKHIPPVWDGSWFTQRFDGAMLDSIRK